MISFLYFLCVKFYLKMTVHSVIITCQKKKKLCHLGAIFNKIFCNFHNFNLHINYDSEPHFLLSHFIYVLMGYLNK